MPGCEKGKVYLVGAGPGDPGLITSKGKSLLEFCDTVVYDNLIPDELIVTLPQSIEKHYVGKRGGKPCVSQNEINSLLLKLAKENKAIVRLKGSDPLIFGRGGEEARFLKSNNIRFEIVPGVTAACAGTAYAGIPLTDREKASFVMLATGHKAIHKKSSTVQWDWVAKAKGGTIVIYMGVGEIANISSQLLDNGIDPQTRVAMIERGTMPTSRTVLSTVESLVDDTAKNNIKAPALFVIGDTVDLKDTMDWIEQKPLLGKRVMVTRPGDQAREMYELLREQGAEVLPYPTILTKEVIDDDAWSQIDKLSTDNKWLLFTSENGVKYFIGQFLKRYGDIRKLAEYKIARMGYGTLRALRKCNLTDDFAPGVSSSILLAEELIKLEDIKNSSIVRITGELSTDPVQHILKSSGAKVIPLTVYKTQNNFWPGEAKEKLFDYPPDYIIFTSGRAVDGLMVNLNKEELQSLTDKAQIISIGKHTSKEIESYNLKVAYTAKTPSIESVVEELAKL